MLIMKDIAKVYRTDTVETHALRQFSLTVDEGEFVSVTGPSGSGKTTFLNIAGLLEEYSSGTYELDGKDVSGLSDSERSRLAVAVHRTVATVNAWDVTPGRQCRGHDQCVSCAPRCRTRDSAAARRRYRKRRAPE